MFYIYFIKSKNFPEQRYIGLTDDLKKRLADHNSGCSFHTAKYKPWILVNYIAFATREGAAEFEKYMKGGSGQAFANKRFWK